MKFNENRFKLTLAITGVLLLIIVSAAQAATVIFDSGTSGKAIGIEGLTVPGFSLPFNVAFIGPTEAVNVYGSPPELDFTTSDSASAAVDAVNAELNGANATSVGQEGLGAFDTYRIGYEVFGSGPTQAIRVWEGAGTPWENVGDDQLFYNADARIYADFNPVPVPAAVWLLGGGLVGLLGLRRRFNK